jgi:hypothetical protein
MILICSHHIEAMMTEGVVMVGAVVTDFDVVLPIALHTDHPTIPQAIIHGLA